MNYRDNKDYEMYVLVLFGAVLSAVLIALLRALN